MVINFLDTSSVLHGGLKKYTNIYISPLTLSELEHIKTDSYKNEGIKYLARHSVQDIISSSDINISITSQKLIEKTLKRFDFLSDINDHRIICEAEILGHSHEVQFITNDGAQYLLASQMPHLITKYNELEDYSKEEYYGWGKYYPKEEELNLIYSNPRVNILECRTNEFAEIYEEGTLKDILFWNGEQYRNLNYKEFTSILGERIKPRNLEQKMYLDLLQNKDIPVKLCVAPFGTGKSYLALNYALNALQKGQFEKIVFVKNNLDVKGAGKLGTLPGDEISKQLPWLRQIEDHIGVEKFEEYINTGIIEPAHLSTLRGRDLKNSCIIVDEAENLLTTNIQLLLGRVAENSEIIFCADVKQCDYQDEKMSGIPTLINRLAGEKLFGMVRLVKTERSATAALADLLN